MAIRSAPGGLGSGRVGLCLVGSDRIAPGWMGSRRVQSFGVVSILDYWKSSKICIYLSISRLHLFLWHGSRNWLNFGQIQHPFQLFLVQNLLIGRTSGRCNYSKLGLGGSDRVVPVQVGSGRVMSGLAGLDQVRPRSRPDAISTFQRR